MYEKLCEDLLSIIPDIRWDSDSVDAINQAVLILKGMSDFSQGKEEKQQDDLRE